MSESYSISKLSEKCKRCLKASMCNEKRMEACAYTVPSNTPNMVTDNAYKPNLRNIKLDSTTTVTIDMNDIAKAIAKSFSINQHCNFIGGE